MRISTRDIRYQRRNAGNRTATLDHNGHPKRWYCTAISAKTAILILIEVYGKSSYGDDPKTDNKFNPSTSPKDNQSTIKRDGIMNIIIRLSLRQEIPWRLMSAGIELPQSTRRKSRLSRSLRGGSILTFSHVY
jgi:hypothetical protein